MKKFEDYLQIVSEAMGQKIATKSINVSRKITSSHNSNDSIIKMAKESLNNKEIFKSVNDAFDRFKNTYGNNISEDEYFDFEEYKNILPLQKNIIITPNVLQIKKIISESKNVFDFYMKFSHEKPITVEEVKNNHLSLIESFYILNQTVKLDNSDITEINLLNGIMMLLKNSNHKKILVRIYDTLLLG